jgi:hypothetical protein
MAEKAQDRKGSAGGARRKTSAERVPPSHEEIARRAHEIAKARGGDPGHEVEDWLQAEKELLRGRAKA